jgi:hypothetical protein
MWKVARYRPQAPGDDCGSVDLTDDELEDPERLDNEAMPHSSTRPIANTGSVAATSTPIAAWSIPSWPHVHYVAAPTTLALDLFAWLSPTSRPLLPTRSGATFRRNVPELDSLVPQLPSKKPRNGLTHLPLSWAFPPQRPVGHLVALRRLEKARDGS